MQSKEIKWYDRGGGDGDDDASGVPSFIQKTHLEDKNTRFIASNSTSSISGI